MVFQPKYLVLHDYGTNNAYQGGDIGFNPYHALVRGGAVQYRYPNDPYGQSAPHAYRLNPQAIGLSWYGPSGGKPNADDLKALGAEVARIKERFPDIQVMSHGQAYEHRGHLPQASKHGRGLEEAAWRSALGLGDAPAMTDTPQEASNMPTYKDVGGVPQMAPGTSPAEVAQAQQMAKLLMQGGQGQPRHWLQALGNAMQTGVGALWAEQAAKGQRGQQEASNQALAQILGGANPAQFAGDPNVGKLAIQQALANQQWERGAAGRQMDMKLKQAQINKLNRVAQMGGEMPSNIREWGVYNKMSPAEQEKYLTMKRAQKILDLGTSYGAVNPVNPSAPVASVAQKDIVGQKAQMESGKELGKAQASLPNVIDQSGKMLLDLDRLEKDPYLNNMVGPVAGRMANWSAASNRVQGKIDEIVGGTFLQAYERLKGGGQITEIEGRKGQDAISRLGNVKQNPNDYRAAINDLRNVVKNGLIRAKVKAGQLPQSALEQLYQFGTEPTAGAIAGDGWSAKKLSTGAP